MALMRRSRRGRAFGLTLTGDRPRLGSMNPLKCFSHSRWITALTLGLGAIASLQAAVVPVDSVPALRAAVQAAAPGDEIVLAPGVYAITGNITATAAGSEAAPITLRAAARRSAVLRFDSSGSAVEGLRIIAPWWRLEGLVIEGACSDDSACEHAIHLAGNADHFVLRDSELRDFNAQIKSNGEIISGTRVFPDDVLIEGNLLHDTRIRATDNPVTKIDVVGGRRWIVRGNEIADFGKGAGDQVSYGAFLKGNSRDGLFERNLVRCTHQVPGGVRIGLSLGGGGTGASYCEEGSCDTEHQNGTLRNNVILDCSDVGIYLNKAANTRLAHNLLHATSGIDVRYATSTAELWGNLLDGRIRNRDGGSHVSHGDWSQVPEADFVAWFQDPAQADFRLRPAGSVLRDQGEPLAFLADDFCGAPRDVLPDIGAFEFNPQVACDTRHPAMDQSVFADGFEPLDP